MPTKTNHVHTFVDLTDEQLNKNKMVAATIFVILGSIIYALAIVMIFTPGRLISSGVTGVSQLIVKIINQLTNNTITGTFQDAFLAIALFVLNIPLFLVGYKHVSKKFAFLTLLSILVQTAATYIFTALKIDITTLVPEFANNRLLLAILGGGLAGLGAALCLKFGGSSGGTDIIANALVLRRGASFTKPAFIIDFTIVFLSGFSFEGGISFSLADLIFTLIRLVVYLAVINSIYDIYHPSCIRIITTHPQEIKEYLFKRIYHGITEYPAICGYSGENKTVFEIFASSYEVEDYIAVAKHFDPQAFIVVMPISKVKGNLVTKTII